MGNYRTQYHRDGTVTYWSVHGQAWIRRAHRVPDNELAARSEGERRRIIRHLGPSGDRIARIHQAPTGRWHVTPEAAPCLREDGPSFRSRRAAIRHLRANSDLHRITHYRDPSGRLIDLD